MLVSRTVLCASCGSEEQSGVGAADEQAPANSDSAPKVGDGGVYPDDSELLWCLLRRIDIANGATGESINVAWRDDGTVYDHRGEALLRSTRQAWDEYVVGKIPEHDGIDEMRPGGDLLHSANDGHDEIPQRICRLQVIEDDVVRIDIIDTR